MSMIPYINGRFVDLLEYSLSCIKSYRRLTRPGEAVQSVHGSATPDPFYGM